MWENLSAKFYLNFIADDRWKYIVDGLKVTLTVTFFAVLLGIVIGFVIGVIRSTYDLSLIHIFVLQDYIIIWLWPGMIWGSMKKQNSIFTWLWRLQANFRGE